MISRIGRTQQLVCRLLDILADGPVSRPVDDFHFVVILKLTDRYVVEALRIATLL